MPEQQFTLRQLNQQISQSLTEAFPTDCWLLAEISEINENRSGHCYLELVEKDDKTQRIVAKQRATIWGFTYKILRSYFESTTGQQLARGMKVLIKVGVTFHELYSLSLNITDIDPTYTLGDLARQRQQIIEQLKADGVFDMNREQQMPALPQRIAIISSGTAAGYGDFMNQIAQNPHNFVFYTKLFKAVMQGDKAERSIIAALDRIAEYADHFDTVVLIRGGGSKSDLNCFDSYDLAANVAQFPLPVVSGIGHERDESIVDLVAHTPVKTPTAAAEFLVDMLAESESYLNNLKQHFTDTISGIIEKERQMLGSTTILLQPVTQKIMLRQTNRLHQQQARLQHLSSKQTSNATRTLQQYENKIVRHSKTALVVARSRIQKQSARLKQAQAKVIGAATTYIEKRQNRLKTRVLSFVVAQRYNVAQNETRLRYIATKQLTNAQSKLHLLITSQQYLSPEKTLNRGYGIVKINGLIVKRSAQLHIGDTIETQMQDGAFVSVVKEKL